jgi:hypothetical protein
METSMGFAVYGSNYCSIFVFHIMHPLLRWVNVIGNEDFGMTPDVFFLLLVVFEGPLMSSFENIEGFRRVAANDAIRFPRACRTDFPAFFSYGS